MSRRPHGLIMLLVLVIAGMTTITVRAPWDRIAGEAEGSREAEPTDSSMGMPLAAQFTRPVPNEEGPFTRAQIRWCLREEIRIRTIGARILSDSGISRLNERVSAYNDRCGRFRYEPATLEAAQRDIGRMRSLIIDAAALEARAWDEESAAQAAREGVSWQLVDDSAERAEGFRGGAVAGRAVDLVIVVMDARLEAVAGVEVRITNEGGYYSDLITDERGRGRLSDVPPGLLQVDVQLLGDPFRYRFHPRLDDVRSQAVEIILPMGE